MAAKKQHVRVGMSVTLRKVGMYSSIYALASALMLAPVGSLTNYDQVNTPLA